MRLLRALIPVAALLLSTPAAAHITLMAPTPRHTEQKIGPCGVADDARGDKITVFAPGETIQVVWDEFVNHPGHYRISFDPDGFDDFAVPASFDELYSNDFVLVDGIADKQGGMYMQEVTLPNIECDNCTLQVIQMMTDKPPYGDGNDLYFQCADLILEGPVDTTGSTTDDSTTGGSGSDSDATTGDPTTGTTGAETSAGTGEATTDATTGGTSSGSASGSSSAGSTDAGSTAGSGDTEGSATAAVDSASGGGTPDESGCSCTQSGAEGGSGGAAALVALAWGVALRRRRRCG